MSTSTTQAVTKKINRNLKKYRGLTLVFLGVAFPTCLKALPCQSNFLSQLGFINETNRLKKNMLIKIVLSIGFKRGVASREIQPA